MKATITSHEPAVEAGPEIHRFGFFIEDGQQVPLFETISLRTAKVLVRELEDGTAFVAMLRVIVATSPNDYDALIGRTFEE